MLFWACLACLLSSLCLADASASSFNLSACEGLALQAQHLTFLNTSQFFTVDVPDATVALSSPPLDPFFGQLARARLTTSAAPIACQSQLDALPQQFECDFYTHASADTGFAFADGSSGDGVGYWSHPDGDASQPMQMILRPGVYCPSITALQSSYFWVRAISMDAGSIVLDAGGDPDAQFVFQSDVLVHFEGTSVSLANNASASNVLWRARNSLSIGVGETQLQTDTVGTYATGTGCGIWMRQTNLRGRLLSGCNIQLEGASSIHVDVSEAPPPPLPPDEPSSFFESRAGIAAIATGSAVAVSALAAGLWVRAQSLAGSAVASQVGGSSAAKNPTEPPKRKDKNPSKKKKKNTKSRDDSKTDKKRLIDAVRDSDQAAVSDLLHMPSLKLAHSRLVQVCID